MFFAGRPELKLPPAPETRLLRVLRWVVVLAALTNASLLLVTIVLNLVSHLPWLAMVPAFIIPVAFLGVAFEIYAAERRRHELAYWTAPRLEALCPSLWYLYRAANGPNDGPRLQSARRAR